MEVSYAQPKGLTMGKQLLVVVALVGLGAVAFLLLNRAAPRRTIRDLSTARQQLVEAWKSTRSVQAEMEMRADGPAPALQRGTYEMKEDSGRRMVRVELQLLSPLAQGAGAAGDPPRLTSISDGQYTYVLNEQGGRAMARKSPVDPSMHMDPVAFFQEMEEHGELELLPDETLNGQAVTVIRVIPKGATLSDGYVNYYIAQDSGLIVKMIATEPSSGTTTHAGLTDIRLNVDIPSERFVFQAPPGTVVEDMTVRP